MTVKLAVPTFPAASAAVQVTVVVPAEKVEPDAGVQVGPVVTAKLSLAVTAYVTAKPELSGETTVMSLGTDMVGLVESRLTATVKAVLIPLVAVHVTVEFPIGNVIPDAVSHVTDIELPSCVAVTEKVPTAPEESAAPNDRFPGFVI